MAKQDEFEKLIESFKLDDVAPEEPQQAPPARRMFDYEQEDRRYQQAAQAREQAGARPQQPPRRPAQQQRPAAQQPQGRAPAQTAVQTPPRRPAPGAGAEPRPQQPKRNFQVRINDEAFYEPTPAYGGGGGASGGGRDGGGGRRRGGGAGRWAKALLVLVIALALSLFLAFFALQSASDLFGLNQPDQQIPFDLTEGLSMSQVASQLKEAGIITQPLTFQLYAGLKNDASEFQPGSYVLNSNMSYDEIIVAFRTHAVPKVEVRLTFQEGMTLSEIAQQLEENNVCTAADLFAFLDQGEFPWDYAFLEGVPEDESRFRRFEGSFFPDTYDFYEQENVATVVQKFFNRFDELTDTDEINNLLKENNMTLDEAVTLASIVQKEAGDPEDMRNVSGVFHKRLANPTIQPTLGSDVTILYVENDIKPYLNVENQAMYDAYNTYVCTGLPVGPICNPGMDAIQAALDYTPTDYYYFIADRDGNFYYARTLEEHEANIRAAGISGVHGLDVPTE